MQKHFLKNHVTNHKTRKVLDKRLPEITKRSKQNLDEIVVEDGELVNTKELIKRDDDYDPKIILLVLNLKKGLALKVSIS